MSCFQLNLSPPSIDKTVREEVLSFAEIEALAMRKAEAHYENSFRKLVKEDYEKALMALYLNLARALNEWLPKDQYPVTIEDVEQCFSIELKVKVSGLLDFQAVELVSGGPRVLSWYLDLHKGFLA